MRSFFIRSLRYLNGRTLSPFPTEAGQIAIVGSIDPSGQTELGLKNLESAIATARYIGKALAEREYGLQVYSSDPEFIESAIVAGYFESDKVKAASVRVVFPRDRSASRVPSFSQFKDRPDYFRLEIDENPQWENSFYRSLAGTSGVLLLGGGRSTFVAGVIAKMLEKPVLAIDAFGGAASDVWEMLDPNEDFILEDERRNLAIIGDKTWALSIVDIISAARKRRAEARRGKENQSRQARASLNYEATSALVVFILSVSLIVFTWDNSSLSRTQLLACLVTSPMLAGFSGAFIRRVADIFEGQPSQISRNSGFVLGVLGAVAGGFSGLLFLMPQLTATTSDSVSHALPVQVSRLVPFAMITGFLAGFTANLVYEKLREAKAMDGSSVESLIKRP